MVHCQDVNLEPGEFVMTHDIRDIPKIKEKWGSTRNVYEPIRCIILLKAHVSLWKQEGPVFKKILAAAFGRDETVTLCVVEPLHRAGGHLRHAAFLDNRSAKAGRACVTLSASSGMPAARFPHLGTGAAAAHAA